MQIDQTTSKTTKDKHKQHVIANALLAAVTFTPTVTRAADPLPSWNDAKAKQSMISIMEKFAKEGSQDFVLAAGGKTGDFLLVRTSIG